MYSVIFVLAALVAALAVVVWNMLGENEGLRQKLVKEQKARETAQGVADEYEQHCARLVGELSHAMNTISLMVADQAKGKKVEPIRAHTAAEVRKAVERRNFEEMNDGRSDGSKDSVSENAPGGGVDSSARGA